MKVIKRNSNVEDFNVFKIKNAITQAMQSVNKYNENTIEKITNDVIQEFEHEEIISIEEIQDVIENSLIKENLPEVAKEFILYRDRRRRVREQQARLYEESQKQMEAILNAKGIENTNANVDEGSFSGKNSKITSHFLKEYALTHLIDKEVAQAHRDGLLYIHDLDNYASGMHNCLNIDFHDLFENNEGFTTRNGDVRKPNDIMTFFQLVAVVFQCESQVQFGGVGANKIDYDAAPYVAITFKKEFKEALIDLYEFSDEHINNIMNEHNNIIRLENNELKEKFPDVYRVAERRTHRRTMQGAESLYHNLNTLESRAGSQVPFHQYKLWYRYFSRRKIGF